MKELVNHVIPQLIDMYETEDNKYVFCFVSIRPHILHGFGKMNDLTQLTSMPDGRVRLHITELCSLTFPVFILDFRA